MSDGATTPRHIVVLGPPGAGGDAVVPVLVTAGYTDRSAELAAANDSLLAAQHATRTAPPPGDVVAVAGIGAEWPRPPRDTGPGWVAHDDATVLTLAALGGTVATPDLAVLVWCAPSTTVGALGRRGIERALALALWNRAVREALRTLAGFQTVVLDGDAWAADGAAALAPLTEAVAGVRAAPVDRPGAQPTIAGCGAEELGITPPRPGRYRPWTVPAVGPAPPWCDELLRVTSAAHRAMLEARDAWQALDAARRVAPAESAAVAAVREREVRELHDRVAELEARVAQLDAALEDRDRARATAEDRATALARRAADAARAAHAAHVEIDRVLTSRQWKVGGVLLAPFRAVRRPRPALPEPGDTDETGHTP